jgi:hypothetical protein
VNLFIDNETRHIVDPTPVSEPKIINGLKFIVRVVPCTGREPATATETEVYLSKQIKFMVFKKEHSQLALVGGRYDHELDGTDWTPPSLEQLRSSTPRMDSDIGFHRCILRHVKDQLDLDLSGCKQWWRFVTIFFDRGSYTEVTLIYLVSLWDIIPDRDQFLSSWEKREYSRLDKIRAKEIAKLELERAKKEKQKERTLQASETKTEHKDSDQTTSLPFQSTEPNSTTKPQGDIYNTLKTDEDNQNIYRSPAESSTPKESVLSKPSLMVEDKGGVEPQSSSTLNDSKNNSKEESDVPNYPPPVSVDMKKAPKNIYVYTATKREKYKNLKSALISLDGLLEYDLEDDYEDTFEVSLFAENFNEMLQRDFGKNILNGVTRYARRLRQKEKKEKEERAKAGPTKTEVTEENKKEDEESKKPSTETEELDKKRKREDETESPDASDPNKKPKPNLESDMNNNLSPLPYGSPVASFPKEEYSSLDNLDLEQEPTTHLHPDEMENYPDDKELGEIDDNDIVEINSNTNPKEEDDYEENLDLLETESKDEGEPVSPSKESNMIPEPSESQTTLSPKEDSKASPSLKPELKKDVDLERAFHYFDRERVGYLKSEDLENLFHSLGQCFSKIYVRDLVSRICEPSKSHSRRFYYRVLFESANNIPPSPANHE